MSTTEGVGRVAHFGVVLGPLAEQPCGIRALDALAIGVNPADLGAHQQLYSQLCLQEARQFAPVSHGESSCYFASSPEFGAFIKFLGAGWGEFFAIKSPALRYIGPVRDGSWAYIPPGMYFYFTVKDSIVGDLLIQSVGAAIIPPGTA